MRSLVILALVAIFAAPQATEARSNRNKIRSITKASDEWRKTYKFNKNDFKTMQEQLSEIVAIDHVLSFDSVDNSVKTHLRTHRDGALKKIADMDDKVVPYLIREFANNVAELERDHSSLEREPQKLVQAGIVARQEAIELSLSKVGLSAIPHLTKFQTITVKHQARTLSDRTQKMISAIINYTKLEQEKAEFQKMVGSHDSNAAPQIEPAAPPSTENLQGDATSSPGQALE